MGEDPAVRDDDTFEGREWWARNYACLEYPFSSYSRRKKMMTEITTACRTCGHAKDWHFRGDVNHLGCSIRIQRITDDGFLLSNHIDCICMKYKAPRAPVPLHIKNAFFGVRYEGKSIDDVFQTYHDELAKYFRENP